MARLLKVAAGTAALLLAGTVAAPEAAGGPLRRAARDADLQVTKTVSPDPMVIGAQAVYTVKVTNVGDRAATDVTVTDTLPDRVTAGASGDCSPAGRQVVCGGPGTTVPAGGSVVYRIPVTVDPALADGTNLTNRADVSTSTSGARTGGTQLISQTRTRTDVEITKTGPAEVAPDGTITYTLAVTNHGPSDAVDVTVQDPTNGNLTTIVDLPAECPASGLTVSCPLGTLGPGETKVFTFTVKVNDGVGEGTAIQNCAMVYTGSRETNMDNNKSCVGTTVGPDPGPTAANISISKTGPATVNPDGTLTYTLKVVNQGGSSARNVVVMDPINKNVTLVDYPDECRPRGASLICSLGTIEAGGSKTITLTERVDAGVQAGSHLHNCAATLTTTRERDMRGNAACTDTVVKAPKPKPTPKPKPKPTPKPKKKPRPAKPGSSCRCYGPGAEV
ncbi:COG1361 S-layer family protein [Spirillospora sp. CA-253888]